MKRRWPRLLIAYLVAGFICEFLITVITDGLHGGISYVVRDSAWFFLVALFWPAWLTTAMFYGYHQNRVVMWWLVHLGIGVLAYWLLSLFAPKRYRKGLCPICGYDLRATPDRCPECGAVVRN